MEALIVCKESYIEEFMQVFAYFDVERQTENSFSILNFNVSAVIAIVMCLDYELKLKLLRQISIYRYHHEVSEYPSIQEKLFKLRMFDEIFNDCDHGISLF